MIDGLKARQQLQEGRKLNFGELTPGELDELCNKVLNALYDHYRDLAPDSNVEEYLGGGRLNADVADAFNNSSISVVLHKGWEIELTPAQIRQILKIIQSNHRSSIDADFLYKGSRLPVYENTLPARESLAMADLNHGLFINTPKGPINVRVISPNDELGLRNAKDLVRKGYSRYQASDYKENVADKAQNGRQSVILVVEDMRRGITRATVTVELGKTETMSLIASESEILSRLSNGQFSEEQPESTKYMLGHYAEVASLSFTEPAEEGYKIGIDQETFPLHFSALMLIAVEVARRNGAENLTSMIKPELHTAIRHYTGVDIPTVFENYYIDPTSGDASRPNGRKIDNLFYFLYFSPYFLAGRKDKDAIKFQILDKEYTSTDITTIFDTVASMSPNSEISLSDGLTIIRGEDTPGLAGFIDNLQILFNDGTKINGPELANLLAIQIFNWHRQNKSKTGPILISQNAEELGTQLIEAYQLKKQAHDAEQLKDIEAVKEKAEEAVLIKKLAGSPEHPQSFQVAQLDDADQKVITRYLNRLVGLEPKAKEDKEYYAVYDLDGRRIVCSRFPWINSGDVVTVLADGSLIVTNSPILFSAVRESRHWLNFGDNDLIRDTAERGYSLAKAQPGEEEPSAIARQRGLLQSVAADPVLKEIRDTRVAVLGLGTVGGKIAEALARLGVNTIDGFENPEETYSVSNANRTGDISLVGEKKWTNAIQAASNVNPFADQFADGYTYRGIVDPVEFDLYLHEAKEKNKLPDFIFLALDNISIQASVHEIAQKYGAKLILITDIGSGAQIQIFNYPKDKLLQGKVTLEQMHAGDKAVVPKMLGQAAMLLEFDSTTVESFLAGSLGYFPQSNAASMQASVLATQLIVEHARKGTIDHLRKRTYTDTGLDLTNSLANSARSILRIELSKTLKKIQALVATRRKSQMEQMAAEKHAAELDRIADIINDVREES